MTDRKKAHVTKRALGVFYVTMTVAVMIVIFCLSSQNGEESGEISNRFLIWLLSWMDGTFPAFLTDFVQTWIRKMAHFSIYLLLGFFAAGAVRNANGLAAEWSLRWYHGWILVILYACTDEFHQYFVPGRACQLRDVLIDAAGGLVGVGLSYLLSYLNRKWHIGKDMIHFD